MDLIRDAEYVNNAYIQGDELLVINPMYIIVLETRLSRIRQFAPGGAGL